MAKRKEVNFEELLKMIEDQVPQKDIMEKFGFGTVTQLKTAYANALMETGKATSLVGGRQSGAPKEISRVVKVNKRGSLIIPKQLVDSLGVKVDSKFEVRKSQAGLSLKRV